MFSPFQSIAISALALVPSLVQAFDMSRNDNVAVYWGQDAAGNQQRLDYYCQDDSIDTIPLAFLSTAVGDDGLPTVDFSNICSAEGGSSDCSSMATDIQACQAKGKTVTISIGGATSDVILSGDSEGKTFADTIWNSFLGGSSDNRPFGDAILDGVDLDLESGSGTGYAAFVTQLRTYTDSANKTYYVTGAPQCPYPDQYIGSVLDAVGFDAVYVQFYNNYCGLTAASTSDWNFGTWDTWAKSSPNPDVKVYIGAPASSSAAGSGYVDIDTLSSIALENREKYTSFGGVMLWEASEAYSNNRFDAAIKSALAAGGSSSSASSSTKSASASSTKSASASATSTSKVSTVTSSAGHASSSASASISVGVPSSTAATSSAAVTPAPSQSSFSSKVATSTRSHSRDFSSSSGIAASLSLGLAASSSAAASSSSLAASAASPSSSSSSSSSCSATAWSASTTYWAGDEVSYSGSSWTAKWWTVGNTPGVQEGDVEQAWDNSGSCDGSSTSAASATPSSASSYSTYVGTSTTKSTTTKRAVHARHARRFGRVSH